MRANSSTASGLLLMLFLLMLMMANDLSVVSEKQRKESNCIFGFIGASKSEVESVLYSQTDQNRCYRHHADLFIEAVAMVETKRRSKKEYKMGIKISVQQLAAGNCNTSPGFDISCSR